MDIPFEFHLLSLYSRDRRQFILLIPKREEEMDSRFEKKRMYNEQHTKLNSYNNRIDVMVLGIDGMIRDHSKFPYHLLDQFC